MLDLKAVATIVNDMISNDHNPYYASDREYWKEQQARLDLLLYRQFVRFRRHVSTAPFSDLKGLVITEEEVSRYLVKGETDEANPQLREVNRLLEELDDIIWEKTEESKERGIFLSLPYLFQTFRLERLERDMVLMCLAAELDRKYEKIFAYLQDDVTQKWPTIGLLLDCLCEGEAEREAALELCFSESALFKYVLNADDASHEPFLSRKVKLHAGILEFFVTSGKAAPTFNGVLQHYYPEEPPPALIAQSDVRDKLYAALAVRQINHEQLCMVLRGAEGAGKKLHVRHLAASMGRRLLIVDLRLLPEDEHDYCRQLRHVLCQAFLKEGWLCFAGADLLFAQDGASSRRIRDFWRVLADYRGPLFLLVEHEVKLRKIPPEWQGVPGEIPPLSPTERRSFWEALQRDSPLANLAIDWDGISTKFRLTPGQIQKVWQHVEAELERSERTKPALVEKTLHEACYLQIQHNLEKKAKKIVPARAWDDLILPPEQKNLLKNVINQVRYRHVVYQQWGFDKKLSYGKGISVLFSGPPGTGKTMAAEIMAGELMLELYKIDLSQLISKYIGETEKNLHEVFREASSSSAILFFDEADALFGKRSEVKDSHDRYANVEVAYLLQQMEEYEGISILATNYSQNIDEAFMRRINYVVKFPFPDADYRERLWRAMIPREMPVSDDIDFPFLAEKFLFAGGNIKNIVLSAAFIAVEHGRPVGMKEILQAVKYELHKTGRILLKEELDVYRDLLDDG